MGGSIGRPQTWFACPGRMSAILFAAAALIGLALQFRAGPEMITDSLQSRIVAMQEYPGGYVPYVARFTTSCRQYGWPVQFATVQEDHWYKCAPGAMPTPAPSRDPPGLQLDMSLLNWFFRHSDPTLSTWGWMDWPWPIFALGLLHIAATIVAVMVAIIVRRFHQ